MSSKPKSTFFKAFTLPVGNCRATCNCGKIYYNSTGGWDFTDNELKELRENQFAIDLDYSVSFVGFEGSVYVYDCSCWHERALKIQSFLDGHSEQIADYLNGEIEELKKALSNAKKVG